MQRHEVVQGFLDCFQNPRYLEVGVQAGLTFHELKADRKVAVDPNFTFEVPTPRIGGKLEYNEITSDEYFGNIDESRGKFDVIYLDGLHTFEQTLRDLLNAISYLEDGGVIVIDDVLPTSYTSSLPSLDDVLLIRSVRPVEAADPAWMGDVYRLVMFVESFMQAYSYATVAENHGQLVLWRQKRAGVLNPLQTVAAVGNLDYVQIFRRASDFRIMPYAAIMADYKSAVAVRKT